MIEDRLKQYPELLNSKMVSEIAGISRKEAVNIIREDPKIVGKRMFITKERLIKKWLI